MPRNCFLGCKYNGSVSIHRFPNPNRFLDTFKAWVQAIGKINASVDEDITFYSNKRICDLHFTEKDRNRNNRLNCLAVPSLCLPNDNNNQADDFTTLDEQEIIEEPPTSIQPLPNEKPVEVENPGVCIDPIINNNYCEKGLPNISVFSEHNYHQHADKKRKVCLKLSVRKKSVGVYRKSRIRTLLRKIHKLKNQNLDLKTRLSNTDKVIKDRTFEMFTETMTPAAKLFTNMQYYQTHKEPAGRRFSLDEKILSLSIFKESRKCYDLLSNLFTLPSPKTLKKLLAEIKNDSNMDQLIQYNSTAKEYYEKYKNNI